MSERLVIIDGVRTPFCKAGTELAMLSADDLGRIAEFGSVKVPELLIIEAYATVFQLVSTVRAVAFSARARTDL